ncbi:hypothetical protein V9T40_001254 [Parthenolecanium corni]|uniref:Uncharacterized protein n=1 Tax=Parthenolecanium corni TaxID=536013 RepID=A0AAN9TD67_9HEMI
MEVEVEQILAADAAKVSPTEASTSAQTTESTTPADPKKIIVINPPNDDPNRTFKRKKVVAKNPPAPNPPTSFEDRQARKRESLHNFYRRRFSNDARMVRGQGFDVLPTLSSRR